MQSSMCVWVSARACACVSWCTFDCWLHHTKQWTIITRHKHPNTMNVWYKKMKITEKFRFSWHVIRKCWYANSIHTSVRTMCMDNHNKMENNKILCSWTIRGPKFIQCFIHMDHNWNVNHWLRALHAHHRSIHHGLLCLNRTTETIFIGRWWFNKKKINK